MSRLFTRAICVAVLTLLFSPACGDDSGGGDEVPEECRFWTDDDAIAEPPIHTPRWAFEPWISKDISDGQDTRDFVRGFRDRDIPVGVVVIDSPWETHYNTFIPNPTRYPGFQQLIDELHADDIRIVLWTTQMVNKHSFDAETGGDEYEGPSPNHAEGERCGFYVNDGDGYLWWKGVGAGLDFFNEDAVAWWRRQQDHVLDMGIDGWKLDFGEDYLGGASIYTKGGVVERQAYSEAYYRDFLTYGVHKRGPDFLTMVRPWDESYGFEGRFYARPEHAPVGWVGDNRRDWIGLADALDHIFRSVDAGYAVVGSDLGGYLDRDDLDLTGDVIPFDTLNFARWTAAGALMPFFQLHGRANITPWTVPDNVDETVALYRYWATLHHELVPFFYSLAMEQYAGTGSVLSVIGSESEWAGDYRFMAGDAFLVAPILDATGIRDVALPAGSRWHDWWDPTIVHDGGQTLSSYDATDRARMPLFVREGAIIPTQVSNDATGLGSAASAGHLTVAVYPAAGESQFRLHDNDDQITTLTARAGNVSASRLLRPTVFRIFAASAPTAVMAGTTALPERPTAAAFDAESTGWRYDGTTSMLWVRVAASASQTDISW